MFQSRILPSLLDPEDLPSLRGRVRAEVSDYARFCRGLAPDYGRVKRDIALGYLGLVAIVVLAASAEGVIAGLAAAVLGAIGIGYAIAYLQLFIHEGAHYNLASDKTANDRMANWLICWQVGTSIAAYRRTHAEHHRSLGKADDTEISYTRPLTWRFLAEMVTGIHALRVFTGRTGGHESGAPKPSRRPLLIGGAAHLAIIAGLLVLGAWPAVLAWLGGMGVFFPLFATVRQLLEHRPLRGQSEAEAVTRIFEGGFFARSFGGAGFDRHFLHHIEPQVSYTRYDALEACLMTTSIRDALDARRTTYGRTFAALLRDGRRG